MAARKPWTVKEELYVRRNAGYVSVEKMAAKLGRSKDSVHGYVKKLGLSCIKRGQEHWNNKVCREAMQMIRVLAEAGFRPVEIHTLLTKQVIVSRRCIEDICAKHTWVPKDGQSDS